MAITVVEPTATRDANLSYYVASDNPLIFTFTAGAGETQLSLRVYNSTPTLLTNFDIILSFNASNEIIFDASPYLRPQLNNTNDFNYTSTDAVDNNASFRFYVDYADYPPGSSFTSTNTFTVVKSAKQIGQTYGANLAEYVDFTTQVTDQKLMIPKTRLPYWMGYPFSFAAILNQSVAAVITDEYEENELIDSTRRNTSSVDSLVHNFVPQLTNNPDEIQIYLDDTPISSFDFDITTTRTGTSNSDQFTLPLIATGSYNFVITWGDGNSDTITAYDQAEVTHTYGATGDYDITIIGTCNGWRFNNDGDRRKINDISKWGNLRLSGAVGTNGHFYGCSNLTVSATDTLDLTNTVSFTQSFRQCTSLTAIPNIDTWDFSNVTVFTLAFANNTLLDEVGLGGIDTSAATVITSMYNGCSVLNQDFSAYDLTLCTDAASAWKNCAALNVSFDGTFTTTSGSVTNFGSTWEGCTVLNQSFANLNTGSCTSFFSMFKDCTALDQNFAALNVTALTNANLMFSGVTLSTTNYDNLLVGWEGQSVNNSVVFSGGSSTYTSAGAGGTARAALIADHTWSISDGGGV